MTPYKLLPLLLHRLLRPQVITTKLLFTISYLTIPHLNFTSQVHTAVVMADMVETMVPKLLQSLPLKPLPEVNTTKFKQQ